ncbi:MAG: endolytic transglycosylase MltG [Candidatus Paraimprobicoccus trichonymphae]|uniref:Endolytic murein transglycosylase n=1 Tax=Candidatus Paraimprobicoccus trichonymphae TaxID=3033793 RepID=A0AA48KXR1_9FIRM|nr:MAG: endolytic transglycosylase MltG [Candidatus Paraimprobicoccus trichonymphae]
MTKNKFLYRVIYLIFIILLSLLFSLLVLIGIKDMLAVGKNSNSVTVKIPEDVNLNMVSKILSEKKIIDVEIFFKLYSFITKSDKNFAPGIYKLRQNMDYEEILDHIRNPANNKDIVSVTFREGMNILEISELLETSGVCSSNEFAKICNSEEFLKEYEFLRLINNKSKRYYLLEGYLFPDTYQFYRGEKPAEVLKKFLNNFNKKIIINKNSKEKSIKDLCLEFGNNLDNILSIASLIQAEAADKKDMYKISGIIWNRLKISDTSGLNKFGEYGLNKLNIDATIWYPYRTKSTVPENLVGTFKSRFNTYELIGLTPGAICNPSLDSILATLEPENSDYFYYCHSQNRITYYAKTNSEHLQNLKKAGLAK